MNDISQHCCGHVKVFMSPGCKNSTFSYVVMADAWHISSWASETIEVSRSS